MSGLLRGMLKVRSTVASRTRAINQRAELSSKPPKDNIGVAETAFVMTIFAVAILGPSGWILANVQNYQQR
ncbi:unnamed protein product [Oncorhynchus mykiss]|uniref:Uncharacterized protein n=1 Tax=Oncorhynchus mykiss TaxID=8022 RepID=A0A060XDV7_ONCMY|nr:unnamed protein product [Oncorhynchus mykiss]